MNIPWYALASAWSQRVWKKRATLSRRPSPVSIRLEELELRRLLTVYTIPAVADGIVFDRNRDEIFEGANTKVTTVEPLLDSDPEIGDQRGVYEFNIESIPSTERIASVVLRLDIADYGVPAGFPYSALKFFGGIGDGFVTPSDADNAETLVRDFSFPGTYFIDTYFFVDDRLYDLSLAPSYFQSQLGISAFVSVVSQMLTPQGEFSANSKNNPEIDGSRRPQLIITTTFETPVLTVAVNADVLPEDAGANATTLTITRQNGDASVPVTVALSSSDNSEATVPSTVTIPANVFSVQVDVTIVDDTLLDGTQPVKFVATYAVPLNGGGPPVVDPTFGGENGVPIPGTHFIGADFDPDPYTHMSYPKIVAQPDGKSISLISPSLLPRKTGWNLVRLNSDGSYDSTFGVDGVVSTSLSNVFIATSSGLTLQSDGKIVVVGSAVPQGTPGESHWVVARYLPDGNLDTSFGTDGILQESLTTGFADVARDVVQLADGRLVVGGVRGISTSDTSYALICYLPDGTRDTSFGVNGLATYNTIPDYYDSVHDVALQPDGKILVVGTGNSLTNMGVVRFNPDGSLDDTFGQDGFVTHSPETYFGMAESVVVQPDGKIVIGGRTLNHDASIADLVVFRLTADGDKDTSFSGNGFDIVKLDLFRPGIMTCAVTLQEDGKILLAGSGKVVGVNGRQTPMLVRYLSNGTRDQTFGLNGINNTTSTNAFFAQTGASIMSVAWQPDGRLLALAASYHGAYILRFGANDGMTAASDTLQVTDRESLSMTLSRSTVSESAGLTAVYGTVTRSNSDISLPLNVFLTTSDATGATVPFFVTIQAHFSSEVFAISLVDDSLIDTDQPVTFTASANGYFAGVKSLLVTDNESAGAIFPGNILVTRPGTVPNSYELAEYTPSGGFVHVIPAPWPGGGTRPAGQAMRDLVQDQSGKLYLYNGTASPYLTSYDSTAVAYANQNFTGWSSSSTNGAGGIATYHQFVFVTDSVTAGIGAAAGIVRFDRTDQSVVRLNNATGYQDLTIGLDRLLYALNQNQHIDVYDPVTLGLLRSINLPSGDYRGLAVDANGQILAAGANGLIYRFDANGGQLKTLISGAASLTDIDLEPGGRVIAGSLAGEVIITNVNLANATKFTAGTSEAFVAFAIDADFPIPTIHTTSTPLGLLESDLATSIDSGVLVTDDGSDLVGATVRFSTGFQQGADQLLFTDQHGIHGEFDALTGILRLDGAASVAHYQAALRSVKYQTDSDNPQASRTVTLTVTDGVNSAAASRSILVTATNDPPSVSPNQIFFVPENSPNNTTVGTVVATDDDSPTLSGYTIVSGNATNLFAIHPTTGAIRVADGAQLDFETRRSYAIGITVSDGSLTSAMHTVTIQVTDQNDNPPIVRMGQTYTVSESSPNGTALGEVRADDIDVIGTLQGWTIVSGNETGVWSINPGTGILIVADRTQMNYETKKTYTLEIQVSDGIHNSAVQTIRINLTDGNDNAPAITPGLSFSVPENVPNQTVAGTVTATDADSIGSLQSYTIVSGNNSGAWMIDSVTGLITVKNSALLDFETTPGFTLGITVSDGVQTSAVQTVTIQVINLNESPSLSPAVFSIPEGSTGGLVVGAVQGIDPDLGQTLNYSITAGSTGNKFTLHPTTGVITVSLGATFDFETTPSYSFVVTATDNGLPVLSGSAQVTINLSNGNDPPTITAGQSFFVAENSPNALQIATVDAHDADVGQSLNYTIIGGNGSGAFAINSANGKIHIADSSKLDYETTKSFVLTIQVTDNGLPNLSVSAPVTILVTNVNEPPVVVPATFTLPENSVKTTLVGSVTGLDQDVGQSLLYTILSGNTGNAFSLHFTLGSITVNNPAAVDFETNPSFTLTVKIQDNGSPSQFSTGTMIIHLTDVIEPPQFADQTFHINEGSAAGVSVGTVIASDPDENLPLAYQIIDGDPSGIFSLNAQTGALKVTRPLGLDYETQPFIPLVIQVTKPGSPPLATLATVTVNVEDVNEQPQLGFATFNINENTATGTLVATLVATDPDDGQSVSYSIAAGNTNGAFDINPATGALRVNNGALLNFESVSEYILSIQATDSGVPPLTKTSQVTILLNDLNEPPLLNNQLISTPEGVAIGTILATLTAANQEPEQQLTYSIIAGNANNSFAIDPATGQITVLNNGVLNFEDQTQLVLTVKVVDDGQPAASDTATLTIQLTDVNEPPRLTPETFTLTENSPVGTVVGTILAVDDDGNQQTSYAVTASDLDGLFAISPSGLLTIAKPGLLDFETHPVIHLTVTASDDGTPSASESIQFTVELTNIDEPPEIVLAPGVRILQIPVKPQALDSQARLQDVDTPGINLANSTLQVKVIEHPAISNQVGLLKSKGGDLTVKGRNILFRGIQIAQMVIGKKGGVPLTVNFNSAATQAGVEAVLQKIYFQTKGAPGSTRTLEFSLTGATGGPLRKATKIVQLA